MWSAGAKFNSYLILSVINHKFNEASNSSFNYVSSVFQETAAAAINLWLPLSTGPLIVLHI